MRYIVEVDPTKVSQVRTSLGAINIGVAGSALNFLFIDIPPDQVARVRSLSGVVSVKEEHVRKALFRAVPVDMKLAEFQKLFWSNPITGPASAFQFIKEADSGKIRVPTSESRRMMGAEEADKDNITGKGIRVAVLDTGADYLSVQTPYLIESKSSVEGQIIPADENGHSSHVYTTIAGRPFSSIHGLLKGVAVEATIAAFKVLGYGIGAGTTSSILRGIADAVEWKADIVSMSLGGPEDTEDPENKLISALTKQGLIFSIAAGNSGPQPQTLGTPGACEEALTVGAVDMSGLIAEFSSRGPTKDGRIKPDVVAPGVNILSTSAGLIATMQFMDGPPKLAAISGTSMATPHVSGVVALALQYARSKGKNLTTAHIKEAMAMYGEYSGKKNNTYGWGLITYPLLKRYIDEKFQ